MWARRVESSGVRSARPVTEVEVDALEERDEVLLIAVDRPRGVLKEVELDHELGHKAEHPLRARRGP